MKKENIIASKTIKFAIRIIKLAQLLKENKKEFVLSKQILRSGTAIGALIKGAEHGESMADFFHKMNIALKEANETNYWLLLLKETDYIGPQEFESLAKELEEIIRLLASIVKTMKMKIASRKKEHS